MIRSVYNYLSLFYSLYDLHGTYSKSGDLNLDKLDKIIIKIKNCGPVIIKFTQWITPKLELMYCMKNEKTEWLNKLEVLYDDCNIHDLNFTLNDYKHKFNKNLLDNYRIKDIIGSGSIGQVYLIEDINDNQELILKIIHPNVAHEINIFYNFYKIMNFIPCFAKKMRYYCPFDISEFIISFRKQTNFIEEANNILYFKNKYIDNKFIVIPTLYEISESILIMSYEKGNKIDDITISDYELNKIITIFLLFTNESLICNHYSHGDLHKGNWSIREEDGIYKLVIYDFGFCFKTKKYKDTVVIYYDILEHYDKDNDKDCEYDKLFHLFNKIIYNSDETVIKMYMDENIDKLKYNSMDPYLIAQHFIKIAKLNDYFIHHMLMHVFILGIQNESFIDKCGRSKLYREGNYKSKILTCDLSAVTFCKTHNIFLNFSKRMENKIKEYNCPINELFSEINFNSDIQKLALKN